MVNINSVIAVVAVPAANVCGGLLPIVSGSEMLAVLLDGSGLEIAPSSICLAHSFKRGADFGYLLQHPVSVYTWSGMGVGIEEGQLVIQP